MKYFIVLFLIIITTASFAQSKTGIKLYQNTDFFSSKYYSDYRKELTTYKYLKVHRFSMAVNITSRKYLSHEIEFFVPEILKSTYDVQFPKDYNFRKSAYWRNRISTYSIRYQISKPLTDPTYPLSFSLGGSINPYYLRIEYKSLAQNVYFLRENYYGISIDIIPAINFKITNRLIINLNMPLKVYDIQREYKYIANPMYPIGQQKQPPVHHHKFFEKAYTLRFGILYYLTKKKSTVRIPLK